MSENTENPQLARLPQALNANGKRFHAQPERTALSNITNQHTERGAGQAAKKARTASTVAASAIHERIHSTNTAAPASTLPSSVPIETPAQESALQQPQQQAAPAVMSAEAAAAEAPSWTDIDADDLNNPQLAADYTQEIHDYLFSIENRYRAAIKYMPRQGQIDKNMRRILMDWLVEVGQEYRVKSETLYLAVDLVDRYLSVSHVTRSQLQLVGVTCMLVAAKYEEIYPPTIEEMVYICDNTYTRAQILQMEQEVLAKLEFNLTTVTAKQFLRRFTKAAKANTRTAFLASFLCEMTLIDYDFTTSYSPSLVAATSVWLAHRTLSRPNEWTPTLTHYTRVTPADMRECGEAMLKLHQNVKDGTMNAVYEKYASSRFSRVGMLPALPSL